MDIIKVFLTSHMLGCLMKPIRDNQDFKGAVRDLKLLYIYTKKPKEWFSKETVVLIHFCQGYEFNIVSYWLQQVPWHARNPEHFESLQITLKNGINTAVSFENHHFGCLRRVFFTSVTASLKPGLFWILLLQFFKLCDF